MYIVGDVGYSMCVQLIFFIWCYIPNESLLVSYVVECILHVKIYNLYTICILSLENFNSSLVDNLNSPPYW